MQCRDNAGTDDHDGCWIGHQPAGADAWEWSDAADDRSGDSVCCGLYFVCYDLYSRYTQQTAHSSALVHVCAAGSECQWCDIHAESAAQVELLSYAESYCETPLYLPVMYELEPRWPRSRRHCAVRATSENYYCYSVL